jgi:DNA-directed RNA polymerase beta subunit
MGTDAWMALMPWEGFTYQDGLVVSRSLAERMDLPGVLRVQGCRCGT